MTSSVGAKLSSAVAVSGLVVACVVAAAGVGAGGVAGMTCMYVYNVLLCVDSLRDRLPMVLEDTNNTKHHLVLRYTCVIADGALLTQRTTNRQHVRLSAH